MAKISPKPEGLALAAGALTLIVLLLLGMAASRQPAFNQTKINVEDITVLRESGRGFSQINGTVVNQDDHKRSPKIKILFYGADGGVIGRASGTIYGLRSGERRTFRLFTDTDIGGYTRYSLEVSPAP